MSCSTIPPIEFCAIRIMENFEKNFSFASIYIVRTPQQSFYPRRQFIHRKWKITGNLLPIYTFLCQTQTMKFFAKIKGLKLNRVNVMCFITYAKQGRNYDSGKNQFTAGIHLFKVNKRNIRTRYEICSKLTIKTAVIIRQQLLLDNFQHILQLVLVFLLLTLNM